MSATPTPRQHHHLRASPIMDGMLQDDNEDISPRSKSIESQSSNHFPLQQQLPMTSTTPTNIGGCESALRFLLLPSQVAIVLLLEFLNSFRSFGLRFVLYNYITNEFGIDDTRAGELLGIKGFMDIGFGLAGSILVDIFGVRKVSIAALSVAIVGRTLLAFGRTKGALYLALFLFSPCGDALLSVGLYKVALKKLTTPLTRPLGFALSYSTFNMAGAIADILVDKMRAGLQDLTLDARFVGVGGVYTPIRQFIVSFCVIAVMNMEHGYIHFGWYYFDMLGQVVTWIAVLLTWIIAYCFLEDWTVIDSNDSEEEDCIDEVSDNGICMRPTKPMVKLQLLRRWFPNFDHLFVRDEDNDESQLSQGDVVTTKSRTPNYKMYRTQYTRNAGERTSLCSGMADVVHQIVVLLRLRSTWRVLVFGFASSFIAMNWTFSELILPPFLERRFGEYVPIYTIQSINLFGCLIFPPIVGAFTSGREDFSVVMPGLWIMAISPILVAMSPNVFGACTWQVFMTTGEVLWSPRQTSWTASLAPTGSEGLFFAISSARSVMGPLTDIVMGAINQKYNSNCPECRDQYGHFCSIPTSEEESNLQCASVQESCNMFIDNNQQSCPRTCIECPTWEPTDPSTCWYLLLLASIVTPMCIWFFLPFLRGNHNRSDKCYGILSCTKRRLLGICGALEDVDITHHCDGPQLYEHVDGQRTYNNEIGSVEVYGKEIELT